MFRASLIRRRRVQANGLHLWSPSHVLSTICFVSQIALCVSGSAAFRQVFEISARLSYLLPSVANH